VGGQALAVATLLAGKEKNPRKRSKKATFGGSGAGAERVGKREEKVAGARWWWGEIETTTMWWYLFSGPAGARGGNANLSGPAEEDWHWQMGHARTAGGRTAAEPQAKLVVEVDNNSVLKKLQHKMDWICKISQNRYHDALA
jgi:hypothetical protein